VVQVKNGFNPHSHACNAQPIPPHQPINSPASAISDMLIIMVMEYVKQHVVQTKIG
jgi:hypothetical protein